MSTSGPIARLIEAFGRLPGVGPKTAQRLAMHVLTRPSAEAAELAEAIIQARERVRACATCQNLTDVDPCQICRSPLRDHGLVCVVEEPKDVTAMEKTRDYRGVYHVLHGAISPLAGVGPDQLRIRELLRRLAGGEGPGGAQGRNGLTVPAGVPRGTGDTFSGEAPHTSGEAASVPSLRSNTLAGHPAPNPRVREVILATDPDVEGDATALYLARLLKPLGIRVTRIARGVPEGGDLDYVDEVTLAKALSGRNEL